MRRLFVALLLVCGFLVPAQVAVADECPAISGRATLDFFTGAGVAQLTLDGARLVVPFSVTGFTPTGPRTTDVYFEWYFPSGIVTMVEHSTFSTLRPPRYAIDGVVEVTGGGTGSLTWHGILNVFTGRDVFSLQGNLCVDGAPS